MITIQQIIQANRKQKQLSQKALAKLAGVTQAMVSKAESGKDVRLSTIDAIAKALELTVVAVTYPEVLQLNRLANSSKKSQSILEQIQVRDDD